MPLGGKKKRLNEKIHVYANPGKVEEMSNSKVTNRLSLGNNFFLYQLLLHEDACSVFISSTVSGNFLVTSSLMLQHG